MRTRVGYAGGTKANPTYRQMGDHTETFQVDYDPTKISYADLLLLFWQSHNPQRKAWSRQYRAIILTHNDSQYEQAQQSKEAVSQAINAPVETAIAPLTQFYLAEAYHQKYRLQNTPLMEEMKTVYPTLQGWNDSTAVARMNGYLSGYGTVDTFAEDIKQLGLSEEGEQYLRQSVARQRSPLSCPLPS